MTAVISATWQPPRGYNAQPRLARQTRYPFVTHSTKWCGSKPTITGGRGPAPKLRRVKITSNAHGEKSGRKPKFGCVNAVYSATLSLNAPGRIITRQLSDGDATEAMITKETDFDDVELFAGAGGMAVGLRVAGFSPSKLYELDSRACETLRANLDPVSGTLSGQVIEGRTEDVNWLKQSLRVRLLAAGAPCQPFSLGGKHLANKDKRNLFPEVLRAVRELNPMGIFLENVRGLARAAFRPYLDYIVSQLQCPHLLQEQGESWRQHHGRLKKYQCSSIYRAEYNVTCRVIDAADYGVPQNRKRIVIVATRCDLPAYVFPEKTHSREQLLIAQSTGAYWERHRIRAVRCGPVTQLLESPELSPWRTVRDALHDLPLPASSETEATMNHWAIPGAKRYAGHTGSMLDWPAKTIKAGVHGVPGGENTINEDDGSFRYFTLREAARLQTFPDCHHFSGRRSHAIKQIGNAVPCLLVSALARPLFEVIYAMTGADAVRRARMAA